MSAQYKMKKYLNKLENTSDFAKMDTYYTKVKQYKMAQSGGEIKKGPWRENLQEKVALLDNVNIAQENIKSYIENKQIEIDKIKPNIEAFQTSYKTVESGLADALLFLNEIGQKIKESGALNMSDFDNIFLTISGIDSSKYPTVEPTELWDWVFKYKFTSDDIDKVLNVSIADRQNIIEEIRNNKEKPVI